MRKQAGCIAWNFRRLLQAKAMEAAGMGPDEITKKLRPPVDMRAEKIQNMILFMIKLSSWLYQKVRPPLR